MNIWHLKKIPPVTYGIKDDLKIQTDVNPNNLKSFELNIVNNISVGINRNTNVHNIDVGTNNSSNNSLDDDNLDECLRKNKKDEGNDTDYSTHDTIADCLF